MNLQFLLSAAALVSVAAAASAATAEICIENGTDAAYFFTAQNGAGQRARATLAPGARLCLSETPDHPGGTVAAFGAADQLEGCSRLVGPAGSDTLLDYVDFDRCRWTSNSG